MRYELLPTRCGLRCTRHFLRRHAPRDSSRYIAQPSLPRRATMLLEGSDMRVSEIERCSGHPSNHHWFVGRLPSNRSGRSDRKATWRLSLCDLSAPPTNRASSCLARESNKRQPDASKTLPQVPIPRFGRRNSLSVAGRQRSDGFRRDREQESCSPPPSPIRVADLNCTTDHCCVVAQRLLLIRCAALDKHTPAVTDKMEVTLRGA
jgi:hypothetical protein